MQKHTKKHVRINRANNYESFEMRNRTMPNDMSTDYNYVNDGRVNWTNDDIMTVRRVRSLHRNATNDVANILPSRRVTQFGTVRDRFMNNMDEHFLLQDDTDSQNSDRQVSQIVNKIEENHELMEDTPDAEALRIEALRDIPQSLTIKRSVKARLSASVSQKSKRKPIGCFKRMKYKWSFWWKRRQQSMRNLLFSLEFWYYSIKKIEGHFGSGVATYFRFLRWLFVINLLISIVLLSFLIIPQALYAVYYKDVPSPASFSFSDIFTGHGYFTNTTLYYGFYSTNVLSIIKNQYYSIPASYFFTMFFVYIIFFISVSIKMAKSYRKNFIKTSSGLKNVFANKIFCAWDFSIATEETAIIKSKSFYNEIKELLNDSYKTTSNLSLKRKSQLFCNRFISHTIVLAFLIGLGFVMWELIYLEMSVNLALIISAFMLVVPIIFSSLTKFEMYNNPRTVLYVTLLRTFAIEVVILTILCIFWLKSDRECWETSLGQEVYRLIIFDSLISLICWPLIEYIQKILNKCLPSKIDEPEFDIARNTLNLIYNQTLMAIGLFFSPLLCIIVVLKMAILFYIRQYTVLWNCRPSTKPWRAAQMQTVFLFLVFFSLLVILITLGYTFVSVKTGGCGPFKTESYMYLSLLKGVLNLKENNVFFSILMYLTKPGILAIVLIAMCVATYYLRAKSIAEKMMVNQLRNMLTLQSKDKEFLLNAIKNVTEGVWVYNQRHNTLTQSNNPDVSLNESNMRVPHNSNYQMSPRRNEEYHNLSSSFRFSSNRPSTSGTDRRHNYENVDVVNNE